MRDIHVGKRGPEAAGEEQPDKVRKTVRFEQEASSSSAAASSEPRVTLEYPASGDTQSRPGPALVQKSGHVDDGVQISTLDAFYEMDGRKSRCVGEVLKWYRGEDAGDLNALAGKIWKSNQKIVMDEELVQNGVMNEKCVKNCVMNSKIESKVVMDLYSKLVDGTEFVGGIY